MRSDDRDLCDGGSTMASKWDRYLPPCVWLRPTGGAYFDVHRERPGRGHNHEYARMYVDAAQIDVLLEFVPKDKAIEVRAAIAKSATEMASARKEVQRGE